MSEKKKNPLLAGLISLIPSAISTISTIVKDKKEKKEADKALEGQHVITPTVAEAAVASMKDMVSGSISSKRVLNIGGTTLIIALAMADISAHGLSKLNLALICIGAAYSLGMPLITYLSEKK